MRIAAVILGLSLLWSAQASATPSKYIDLASSDAVLRWINAYRNKPDPAGVPTVVKALSGFAAFKDSEQAGPYTGFIAGVIGANPEKADDLIARMLPLPEADQWVIVRSIAYSEHPEWKRLLRKFAPRMPARKVMIEKYLDGALPTLFQVSGQRPRTNWDITRDYLTLKKLRGKTTPKPIVLEPTPELLDTFWGYYFATATARPVLRIIDMTPWSKDKDNIDKLMLGSMAKYTLATNASRDRHLLAIIKRARDRRPPEVAAILTEVIDAAETVETAKLRKDALGAIDDLRRKGPGYRRNISWWGQIGQGALALGCIAAAATGQVQFGLPCVIGGGVSSAALSFWEKQQ
jgi:hypothetical protein